MKPRVKLVLKVLLYPLVIVRRYIIKHYMIYLQTHDLKKLAGCIYRLNFGKRLNWKNPQNLSEKINWMKFNTDTTLWTELADKYKVRAYVEDKGLKELLVEIYGVWEHAEDIDFDTFCKSDFRAVKVKECSAVKKSKKLLHFVLDDGTGTDRIILSGIHEFYEPEELVGKTLLAITNLPPRAMMGIESCGMLMSAIHTVGGEEKLNLVMLNDAIPAGAKLC